MEVVAAACQIYLGPPSLAQPREAGEGGRVGMGRPRPAGPVEPGAPAVWGGRNLEKAGSSGARIAVGDGMSQSLQTHKIPLSHWCPETRMLGVGTPEGEPGTWREPSAPAPGPQPDGPGLALPRQADRSSMSWRPNRSRRGRAGEKEGGYTGAGPGETGGDGEELGSLKAEWDAG